MGDAFGRLFLPFLRRVVCINIFVYSDESGVFDRNHEDYFVFGGIVFLSTGDKDLWSRKYIAAERNIRKAESMKPSEEVKAYSVSNKSKYKLYSSVSQVERFGAVISLKKLNMHLFNNKKSKQRYLDWAFKMAVRRKLESLIQSGYIHPEDVENIYFLADEHSTATNGRYELKESLERELKIGTFNGNWSVFHEPLFPTISSVSLEYCNSAKKTLVRAADIVANRLYFLAYRNSGIIPREEKLTVFYHPN